jgi:transposase
VAVKDIAVKKYVVRLSAEEREQLDTLIQGGKHGKRKLTQARILLKADTSEVGEGWSDSQIASALNTGLMTIARIRQKLVEEGLDSVLTPKRSSAWRVFDGAAETKLIALACSEPPNGRARWTLRLLEDKVVEMNIVARASDNTIGRTLRKYSQNASKSQRSG